MLQLKSIGTPLILALVLLTTAGCDQAEQSAQRVLDQAAKSARQAIDKTHETAQQALNDTLGGQPPKPENHQDKHDTQDI